MSEDQPGSAEPLPTIDRVRRWLDGHGFALESDVARVFEARRFATLQGQSYRDPNTGKTRSIDVVVRAPTKIPARIQYELLLAVECKYSKNLPWLVRRTEMYGAQLQWTPIASKPMRDWLVASVGAAASRVIPLPNPIGFEIIEAQLKADVPRKEPEADKARSAVRQAVSAAHGLVPGGDLAKLVIPVVVTQGELFSLDYNYLGEAELLSTTWQRLLWTPDGDTSPTVVDVVTRDGLVEYVQEIERSADTLSRHADGRRFLQPGAAGF
jgi:hypothetical protein